MNAPADATGDRRAWMAASLVAAAVSFLPFLRGVAAGHSFFFRDLSRQFFPLRLFALEGLRRGELRFWNPYDNEGVPLSLMPAGYPLELLQALWPSPAGITLLMALHVPLAALAFVLLARELGLRPVAAAGGAAAYALGGFSLSMISLYVYVHAMAWAPLVIWGLLRAASGGRKRLALAALVCGVALSTTGIELVLQAMLVAGVLSLQPWEARRLARVAAAVLLGLGLAAPVLTALGSATLGTARALGFSPDVVLNQSVHPFTFLQVLVADLYGKLSNVTNEWWGVNFFENGFPYVLSLYLGAATLALAAAGLASRRPHRGALAAIGVVAVIVCLGRWGGWPPLLDLVPASWRIFRFPTKAFFTIHTVAALLAAYGLDALCRQERRATRALVAAALLGAGVLALAPALPALLPERTAWFLAHFFPPGLSLARTAPLLDHMLGDAATGGAIVLGLAVLAALASRGRLAGERAAILAAALVAADLLRAGAGLNAMVDRRFFEVAPEIAQLMADLKPVRLHTCDPMRTRAYWSGRAARPGRHEVFTFVAMRDSLAPHYNVGPHVATALGEDLTGLVPLGRAHGAFTCRDLAALVPRLRSAAVTHVASLDPLESADLVPVAAPTPPALAPAAVHVYALRDPLPRVAVAGADGSVKVLDDRSDVLALDVTAASAADVVVRDGWGVGWRATLDGEDLPIAAFEGRHRRVAVPAGTHRLEMRYRPPGLSGSLVLLAVAAGVVAWLAASAGARRSPTLSATTSATNQGL